MAGDRHLLWARANAWRIYLVVAAAGTVCYFFAPGVAHSGALFNVLGLSAVAAILVGARMHRPDQRLPWYLFAIAQTFFVVGDFLYYTAPGIFHYTANFPSAGDAFYITVYPLIIAGLLLLIHTRSPRRDLAALLDALIIGVGVGVVSWVYLMVPYAADTHLALGDKALSIAYPLMDVLVLAVTARLAVDGGRRAASFYLLLGGLLSLVSADSVYGFITLHGNYKTGSALDVGWLIYYFAWGACALHPSMRTLSEPVHDAPSHLSRRRLLLLAGASLLSPVVLMTKLRESTFIDQGALCGGTVVLFVLVVVRLRLVVRLHEDAEARERALREAGAALVSAATTAQRYEAAAEAIHALAGDDAEASVLVPAEPSFESRLDLIPAEARAQLLAGTSVTFSEVPGALATMFSEGAGPAVLVTPIGSHDRFGGLLMVATAGRFPRPLRDSIEALASQVSLAVEAAKLSEDLLRREGEARFRSLVQNSSDIVTVLGADSVIRYQSPSIEHIFGYDPAELVGTSMFDLIHADDLVRIRSLLGDIGAGRPLRTPLVEARWREAGGGWRSVEMLWTDLTRDPNVDGVVINSRDVSERRRFEDRLSHQAYHDPVTDLPNRALFRDRVQHALVVRRGAGNPLAVLFMDLDDFKTVNDSLGHAAGDHALKQVAGRLTSCIRAADTAARFGGDEFAILLEGADTEAARRVAADVLAALDPPFIVEGREVFVRASMGVAVSEALGDERSAEELLREADVAMYVAKERGKRRYEVFETSMHHMAVRRLELTADLRRAVTHEEFVLYYQPVVELTTGRVTGAEALVRWDHPSRGLLPPAEFVPLAEETGLIVPIGRWVLGEACRQAARLQLRYPRPTPLTMAINLSARQLQHRELIDEVTTALSTTGVDPASVTLEITESMVMRDPAQSALWLRDLKGLGVRIAVDDFGTGYSSLNYLCQFPLDVLKVDRSFVDRLQRSGDDRAITQAIVHLATVLGLQAVAEGIETDQQLDELVELGCRYGQGYHLARPMDAAALEAFLDQIAGTEGFVAA